MSWTLPDLLNFIALPSEVSAFCSAYMYVILPSSRLTSFFTFYGFFQLATAHIPEQKKTRFSMTVLRKGWLFVVQPDQAVVHSHSPTCRPPEKPWHMHHAYQRAMLIVNAKKTEVYCPSWTPLRQLLHHHSQSLANFYQTTPIALLSGQIEGERGGTTFPFRFSRGTPFP